MGNKLNFKSYLINENKAALGQRFGDVLNQVHDLVQNAQNMGSRLTTKKAETVVNIIRRIIHAPWSEDLHKYLKSLQKCGVAIMRAIEEKDDLPSVLAGVAGELEKMSSKLGTPANNLGSDEMSQGSEDEGPAPPEHKEDDGDTANEPPQNPEQEPAGAQPGQQPPPGGQPGMPPGAPPMPPGMPPQA